MIIKRRDFIKMGAIATGSLFLPKLLQADPFVQGGNNKVMVVLQLSGGNDGLNTVIPVRNDIYYQMRPSISISREQSLRLNDEVGLNPQLPFLKTLYDEGNLAILNNVGYENPNRSHFRSMDIWQSASQSDQVWNTGWLGRWLDKRMEEPAYSLAIEIDDTLSLALKGEEEKALATRNFARLYNQSRTPYFKAWVESYQHQHQLDHEKPVDYLYQTLASTTQQVDFLHQSIQKTTRQISYPKNALGNSLKQISALIFADVPTKVYYVSVGSFDTHNNQNQRQENLFRQINVALSAFVQDLKQNNRFQDTMIFTFSEFGRRVGQNASNGTDHGTANNMFFISGGLKKQGLLNDMPDLLSLQEGDLNHTVDFKQVYATLLDRWLDTPHQSILKEDYSILDFI